MTVLKRILGWLVFLILISIPAGIAMYYGGNSTLGGMFFIGTVVWVAIAWGAVSLIRFGKVIQVFGWLILFIISFAPAGIAYTYGGHPTLVGKFYLGTLAWVALTWGAGTLIQRREQEI
jgi:hypothetical protein